MRSFDDTGASTIDFAKFNSDITNDLEYYLSRRDKIFMTSTGDFKNVEVQSDLDPEKPIQDDVLCTYMNYSFLRLHLKLVMFK